MSAGADGPRAPQVWAEFVDILGRQRAVRERAALAARIEGILDDGGLAVPWSDEATLRRVAHDLVARAGMLGFPALSRASADVELAIRTRQGIDDAVDAWRVAAREAAACIACEAREEDG
jgi:HPt (histidine-containing phosphotransfer) domain-containing protein